MPARKKSQSGMPLLLAAPWRCRRRYDLLRIVPARSHSLTGVEREPCNISESRENHCMWSR